VIGAALSVGLFVLGRYTVQPTTSHVIPQSISEKSLAVLPFANLSGDPDNAYFAAGIQDEIITRLAKIAQLKVVSCLSTQRFKSAPDDLPATAEQLGVANVLQGSVQRSADEVRVNVQLVKAQTIEQEKEPNDFLAGVPAILDGIRSGKIECKVYAQKNAMLRTS
jgi:TolB-like protein